MNRAGKRQMWASLRRQQQQLWTKQHMGALAARAAEEAKRKTA